MGPAEPAGFDTLRLSVKTTKRIFPEFDLVICYNQLSAAEVQILEKLDVALINNEKHISDFIFPPTEGYHVHWKLYPPRLRIESPEIFIDNDVVLIKRPPEIDMFLEGGHSTLLYQGLNEGAHGQFANASPKGIRINSGIFGMPPDFDFNERARKISKLHKVTGWENKYDEQGLVAAVLLNHSFYHIIPTTTIPIIDPSSSLDGFTTPACCGYHFVQVNYQPKHQGWERFALKNL